MKFSIRTFARTVALGRIPFGASAVADTSSDGDAFSAARTLLTLGTTGQHAFPIHDLVRGLALALDTVAFCDHYRSNLNIHHIDISHIILDKMSR